MTAPPFAVTFFDHHSARFKRERKLTLAELAELIEASTDERKDLLPWLKLARFGNQSSEKGSLRHNANLLAMSGCEGDYDGEEISVDQAREIIEKAGVEAIIYTSPSHTPDAPRFRVICPFSTELQPERQARMVARLNGLFRGRLAAESFTLSQAYYYGHVVDADGNPVAHKENGAGIEVFPTEYRVELIDGRPLDLCDELDGGAIGKSGGGNIEGGGFDYIELQELVRRIISGKSLHPSVASIAGKYARNDWPIETSIELVGSAFTAAAQPRYGGRWQECLDCIRDIYRKEAARQNPPRPQPGEGGDWIWEGEVGVDEARKWLVANLLPENGVALISGQWGAFKTFIALDLAVAVMTASDFIKFPVMRHAGVLLFACEGQNEVQIRIRAAYEARGGKGKAPFAWQETSPRLLDADACVKLVAMIKAGAEEMQRRFGLPVALVIIDTAGKAAGYSKAGEENDSAIANIIMRTLSAVALQTNTLVTAVAHFGKHVETGTRGSSAYEDDADVVLAALAEKNTAGAVTNTRLAARKRRSGPSGEEYPFRTKSNDMGIDPTGIPLNTLIIEWIDAADVPARQPQGKPDPWRKKSLRLLRQALMNVLVDYGKEITPWPNGPTVRAVDLEMIRPEFYRSYPAAEAIDAKGKQGARQRAFHRGISDAKVANLIGSWEIEGMTFVWLIDPTQMQRGMAP
jgi:hypothetical protein